MECKLGGNALNFRYPAKVEFYRPPWPRLFIHLSPRTATIMAHTMSFRLLGVPE